MPNGADKNLRRVLFACAAYRERYGEWPSQARMHPLMLWDLAQILDSEQFQKLGAHLQIRTKDHMGLSVGGRGVVDYNDVEIGRIDEEALQLAEQWLDVHPRRDLE